MAQQEQKTAKIKVHLDKNHTNENTEFRLLFQKETEKFDNSCRSFSNCKNLPFWNLGVTYKGHVFLVFL